MKMFVLGLGHNILRVVFSCPPADGLLLSNHLDDNTLLLSTSPISLRGIGTYPNTQTTTSSRLYRISVSSRPPIVCTLVLILFCRATLESLSSSDVPQSILDVTKRKLRSRYRSSISLLHECMVLVLCTFAVCEGISSAAAVRSPQASPQAPLGDSWCFHAICDVS